MTTLEEEIERLKSSHITGQGWDPGNYKLLLQKQDELRKRRQESKQAQIRADSETSNAAKEQTQSYEASIKAQTDAAARMEELYQQNLEDSTADITAATDQARSDLDPWYQAGTDALGKLQEKIDAGPGDFEKSPGYQFRLDEGQKAIERSAAAKGGALSGAAIKEGMRYGQDYVTNDYDNFLNRYYDSLTPLQQLSGQGMQAATQQGTFSMAGANSLANARNYSTSGVTNALQYGANSYAQGNMSIADILAAQKQEAAQRHYGYSAWKNGEEF